MTRRYTEVKTRYTRCYVYLLTNSLKRNQEILLLRGEGIKGKGIRWMWMKNNEVRDMERERERERERT